ncbi:MAG: ParA family protein [Candidatus Krumholzibacteriota bacterium]|nr:ParA family protein [Candidatus Krumholzibacteriota bacterium]
MKKLAIMTMKGGTGKTTTAVSVAHGLSLSGRRVLLVDCDPQRNSTLTFGAKSEQGLDTLLMTGDVEIIQVRERFFLIDSGGSKLVQVELRLGLQEGRENRMGEALKNLKGCDYLICDCPPSMNLININVIAFCDEVIVPVAMDHLSRIGAHQTTKVVEEIKKMTGNSSIGYRILPTFYDSRTKVSVQVLEQLKEEFRGHLFDGIIRINTDLREAPGHKKTIYEHAPLSRGAFDYYKLTEEILALYEDGN